MRIRLNRNAPATFIYILCFGERQRLPPKDVPETQSTSLTKIKTAHQRTIDMSILPTSITKIYFKKEK